MTGINKRSNIPHGDQSGGYFKELVRDPSSGKLVPGRQGPSTIQVPKSTFELMYTATGKNGSLKGPVTKTVKNPRAGRIIKD